MSAPAAGSPPVPEAARGPGLLGRIGRTTLTVAAETGGMAMIAGRSVAALFPPKIEVHGLVRSMYRFGVQSLPLVVATAFLTGVVVLLMAAVYVREYGATRLVGWGTGYATFREIGPVLIALMFSGRVGSNNTAELATMKVTEQVEALRALAIDPYAYLVIPRLFAMVIVLVALTLVGNLLAIAGGAAAGNVLVGVSYATFWHSFLEGVRLADLAHGLIKAGTFGLFIGIVSCHFGLSAGGGAPGVGRAVNRAVVASAVAIFVIDYLLTYALP
jgi:phospholipid/cholesterol/gamma-HCH transport system permease protein